jgi:Raf kinase inhibitor-like YbhB/YbcL family protein
MILFFNGTRRIRHDFSYSILAFVITTFCGGLVMGFELKSSAFLAGEMMPSKYTCDGVNVSPALSWINPPAKTQAYILIMDDPDAPGATWDHWLLYNIPAALEEIKEGESDGNLAEGVKKGKNSWGKVGYGGPCPPQGTHRYFFKLYALDQKLNSPWGATKDELEKAMKGHILGQATLMGKYQRGQ